MSTGPAGPPPPAPQFLTGAIPSPPYKAFAAEPFKARVGAPSSWGVVPKRLSVWGNNRYGDCVTAEEAAAKIAYSTAAGVPDIFITEEEVIRWCRKHGHLNGATLTGVMDDLQSDPIGADDGKRYSDGPYHSVDWSDDAVLSSAIFTGPVKIAVASGPLSRAGAGNKQGWFLLGAGRNQRSDHCVGLLGYGTVAECAQMLGASPPSNANQSARAYLLFTWGTIGVIDQQSLIGICTEAWVRKPTTPEQPEPNPEPGPPPPGPMPVPGGEIVIDQVNRIIHAPAGWRLVN